MTSPVIEVKNLQKHFYLPRRKPGLVGALTTLFSREVKVVPAVDDITFTVERGEVVGYLGPNGAGKSTTVKMLTGLLVPSAGSLRVGDFVPWKEREHYVRHIGAVFGQRTTLWWDLPVVESLHLLRHMYRIPEARYRRNLDEFREVLEMDEFLAQPVRALSLGQRMRADLCAAMLHDPTILFLDEPTIGLDVVAKERIRRFIAHVNAERNVTVLLTTHDLQDVERLCRRVMIIDHGKLLYDGALTTLLDRFGTKRRLIVDFAEPHETFAVEDAHIIARDALRVTYEFDRHAVSASTLIGRLSARYRIADLNVQEPDIEATIRRIYEGRLLEAQPPTTYETILPPSSGPKNPV